jgi:nucleoside-diphosphate-sugar epimerase
MEQMARLWMNRLPIIITRPFNYTGVGQAEKFLLPKIVSHFRRGERVIELGNIDVERVLRRQDGGRRVCPPAGPRAGRVYNVCSGAATSLKAVVAMMEDIAGYPSKSGQPRIRPCQRGSTAAGDASKLIAEVGALRQISLKEP